MIGEVIQTTLKTTNLVGKNLSMDSFWMDKYVFEDAEAKFYARRHAATAS